MNKQIEAVEGDNVKYYGTIMSIPGGGEFGFIDTKSVTTGDDARLANLETKDDIFIHQDDCASPLRVGMMVKFLVREDRHRGSGSLRAFAAIETIEAEVVPNDGQPIPGFYPVAQTQAGALTVSYPRSDYHIGAKEVPAETVKQVTENMPLSEIPRGSNEYTDEEKLELLSAMLNMFFPSLHHFNANYNILDMSDEDLYRAVEGSEEDLRAIGMDRQIEEIRNEAKRFIGMKATLKLLYDDGLVRPDTIIPIKYLPDLFMAVPVWYFWMKPELVSNVEKIWATTDPVPQEEIKFMCSLFPNVVWAHTYQLFNRRIRSLKMYNGDKVPPFVSRRLRKAAEAFDYVVIATPYHSEAGKDWQNLAWIHLIDPYVLGFKKGIPFIFVLARFSDSGIFPLYDEMVADTIEFLKKTRRSWTVSAIRHRIGICLFVT